MTNVEQIRRILEVAPLRAEPLPFPRVAALRTPRIAR